MPRVVACGKTYIAKRIPLAKLLRQAYNVANMATAAYSRLRMVIGGVDWSGEAGGDKA